MIRLWAWDVWAVGRKCLSLGLRVYGWKSCQKSHQKEPCVVKEFGLYLESKGNHKCVLRRKVE